MQEEYIKDVCNQIKPDLDEKMLGLHPSSNHVFRDEGTLENIAMFPTRFLSDLILKKNAKLKDKQKSAALENKTAEWHAIGLARGLINVIDLGQTALCYATYASVEGTSRAVESGIRGTYRLIKLGAEKAYNQFDDKEESWFKKTVNSVKDQYNSLAGKASSWYQGLDRNRKKQLKRYGQGTWNHLVSAGSVTLGALALLGMCSGEPEQRVEEPTAVVETVRETTRQSESARNQYLRESELRTSSTPARVQRGIPEPRPVQRQPQQIPLNQLSEFGHQRVLAYCSDDTHVNYVMETLREQAGILRELDPEFRMTTNEINGIISVRFGNTTIKVVKDGQTIPQVRRGYDIITLRGHVYDMSRLYNDASAFEATNTYYIVGGCRSDDQVVNHASTNRAMSAGTERENGVNNTDFLVEYLRFRNPNFCSSGNTGARCRDFVQRNSTNGRNTWDGYRAYMHNVAPINTRRWVLPGSRTYVRR